MAPGATAERLEAVMQNVEAYLAEQPEVLFYNIVRGSGGDQGSGQGFIRLKDWSLRPDNSQGAAALSERFSRELGRRVRDANVFVVQPPTVRGLGGSAGVQLFLQDLGGLGPEALAAARDQLIDAATARPEFRRPRTNSLTETPQLAIHIDDHQAGTLGVSHGDHQRDLSIALGGSYVNDFIDRGRVKRVLLQGEAAYRAAPDSLRHWYVRNAERADGVVQRLCQQQLGQRPAPAGALQRQPGLRDPDRHRARRQLRRRDAGDGGAAARDAARHRLRMVGPQLPGTAVGRPGAAAVRRLGAVHLPVPGRAVRELVGALQRDAGGAAGHLRRPRGQPPGRPEQRRVLPGRAAHHRGAECEERDPDRRVRRDAAGAAAWACWRPRSRPAGSACGRS
jgi:hypothetical protein